VIKSNSGDDSINTDTKITYNQHLSLNEDSNKKLSSIIKKPELTEKIYVSNVGKEKTIEIYRIKREPNIELKKVINLLNIKRRIFRLQKKAIK